MNNYKRVVIKVGSSTLTHENGKINFKRIDLLARVLSELKNRNIDVVLVSSGAIAVGVSKLGLTQKKDDIPERQAAAAVGQTDLMLIYEKFFMQYGYVVGQILLTKDIIDNEIKKENVVNTLLRLFELGVIPIVNENDTVAAGESVFGDNDSLSALVAEITGADLLIILSDIDGLFDCDPKINKDAKHIAEVKEIDDYIMSLCGGAGSDRGTGGMITKITAAGHAAENGIDTVIINGNVPENIYKVIEGKACGTIFKARRT